MLRAALAPNTSLTPMCISPPLIPRQTDHARPEPSAPDRPTLARAMTRYRIDPDRSRVVIDARSSVHPIHTETSGLTGWIDVDGDSSVTGGYVELAVDRLRSGNPLEDTELRRRIDSRRFPTITGTVTSVEQVGKGRWRVAGDIAFRGVTRPHTDELTIDSQGDGSLHLAGTSVFDIRNFGMAPPRI